MRRFIAALFFAWVVFLLFRSSLHALRIVFEFGRPQVPFLPDIQQCTPFYAWFSDEEQYVWRYRHYGVRCEE